MKFELSTFKAITSCSILMFANLSAQATFSINSEVISKLKAEQSMVYPVTAKEVEYHPFVKGKIPTNQYQHLVDLKALREKEYDEYVTAKNLGSSYYDKANSIIEMLLDYIKTNDKNMLNNANALVKELKIPESTFSIHDSSYNSSPRQKPNIQLFLIDEKGKSASKQTIELYIKELRSYIRLKKNDEYNAYIPSVVTEYPELVEEFKNFPEEEKYTDGLVKSNITAKRNAYMIDMEKPLVNLEELKGNYKEISSTMLISADDVENRFLKNELSDDLRGYLGYPAGKSNTLMQNIETGKFYMVLYDTFQNILVINDTGNVEKLLTSIGYKTSEQNGHKYIITKHYKVPCDAILYNTLKKDNQYLKKIDTWFDQMQGLRKQALSYNPKFDNYIRIYRLQRNRMSKADISAWTTLTKSAMALNKQFVALNDKLWSVNYDVLDKSYLKNSNDFDNYLGASMGVLGL